MVATLRVPEGDIFSLFDYLSDGIMIVNPAGDILYRNEALKDFPPHLADRMRTYCENTVCGLECEWACDGNPVERAKMEGWNVSCKMLGPNRLLLIKYDNCLGKKIQSLREDFTSEMANGTPASLAAMQVLRQYIDMRYIAIGSLDRATGCVVFDHAYDGEHLRKNALPPLYRQPDYRFCQEMIIARDLTEYFQNAEMFTALGLAQCIGLSLKNHHEECVGYALLADDKLPCDLKTTITLLQELAALYGPYFEVGSAQREMRKAQADALTDVVTGAGNRRACETFIQDCLSQMQQEEDQDEVVAMFDPKAMRNSVVMLIDFDGFKRINDLVGHEEGDRALRLVASELANIDRDSRVFRLGGDELVQVFPRAGDLDAEELRFHINKIEKHVANEGFERLGLSMGVVHFFEGEGSLSSLMTLADARMYHDKRMRSVVFL